MYLFPNLQETGEGSEMGRGDRRTRKGKQFRASHGNTRAKGAKKKAPVTGTAPAAPAPTAGRGKA